MTNDLRNQVCEIRIKANPLILDNRGTLIELISSLYNLDKWALLQDGVSISDNKKSINIVITINSIGLEVNGSFVENGFKNDMLKLVNFILSLDFFKEELFINRIGVRERNCIEFSKTFEELKEKCRRNYMDVPKKTLDALNMHLYDIGYPLIFTENDTTINTMCGPMKAEQITNCFPNYLQGKMTIPQVAMYTDIDCYKAPNKLVSANELLNIIDNYCIKAYEKSQKIKALILE